MDLVVGRIGKPHGIRGELNVGLRTDDPDERFAVGRSLRTDPAERGPLTIESARPQGSRFVVRFVEVADRDTAETLHGTFLVVSTEDLPPLPEEDDFYDHELEGVAVETPDGTAVGHVEAVLHGRGGDTLSIRAGEREILVPFVKDMVPVVDLTAGRIVIDPPDGLLDL